MWDQISSLSKYPLIQDLRRSDYTYRAQVIEDSIQARIVTLATFTDLQNAFDKVWKDGHFVKLLRSSI
jgi:hypothetical protein